MYLAPSAGQFHQATGPFDLGEPIIPLLVEVPSEPIHVSPPSSGELSNFHLEDDLPKPNHPRRSRWRIINATSSVYHWCVDVLLLVIVCFMGCFFYDVELKVVKSDRQTARARGRSGRIVIQTNNNANAPPGLTTSLLRTPPRSFRSHQDMSWNSPRTRDIWDV